MSTSHITRMLDQTKVAEPWVRPFAMEALIRAGEKQSEVVAVFNATSEEQAKLTELLSQSNPWPAGDVV